MYDDILASLKIKKDNHSDADIISINPTTGEPIGSVKSATHNDYEAILAAAQKSLMLEVEF